MQRMKDSLTIKEYFDKLLCLVSKVRLLGINFYDSRIVKKILVIILENFDAIISSLESLKDLPSITFE
jgi:hypothetical protein